MASSSFGWVCITVDWPGLGGGGGLVHGGLLPSRGGGQWVRSVYSNSHGAPCRWAPTRQGGVHSAEGGASRASRDLRDIVRPQVWHRCCLGSLR
jgi:hypothetical protein